MVKRNPNPIDVHVGSRVRMRRMLIGMSQERLGEQLGLTFQQVQKYEKGSNRVSASRLYQMAKILGVPVQYFFEGLPQESVGNYEAGFAESAGEPTIMNFLTSSEGLQLNKAFTQIADVSVRRKVVELVRAIAGDRHEHD
ncbi:helix-turn-helix transcriptional regulator [Kaustia mangrovi]|uniref:Helix-turn-helix transcriptional regulator n=1 Tax=Kaustia mangrovi TaxID=2593653 RepID=A0A7S8C4V8_9HYPH|nr:helix-turn-helix transcriptional regulator [Kaustia mangrovi]QPC43434.1 helix-turn-helix transcriptional regulator [Kaustia mangrovi]